MRDEQKESYIAWLNDAHALEEGLITVLEKQVEETGDLPDLQARLRTHLEETRAHAELVRGCLERLGESPSGIKDASAKFTAWLGGAGMSFTDDALVKHLHSAYTAEQQEVATYIVIRAAAIELEDTLTVEVCDRILAEEEAMAEWLRMEIPTAVIAHLREKVGPHTSSDDH